MADTINTDLTRDMDLADRPGMLAAVRGKLAGLLAGGDAGGAALAFLVRIAGAGLGYALHILLARLLGAAEFGLWAAGWTLLLVIGHAASLGFAESVVRYFTAYAARGEWGQGRGFLICGTITSILFSSMVAVLVYGALLIFAGHLPAGMFPVLALAAVALPFFVFQDWLEGIARAFGRPVLALAPIYILRPCMIAIALTGAVAAGSDATAPVAMSATLGALAAAVLVQVALVWRAAPRELFNSASSHQWPLWIKGSAPLAFIFLIDQLAAYADVLALAATAPAADTGAYFAAARILSLAALAPYAVSVIAGRGFALHNARGETEALRAIVRRTTRWSFWASCALLLVLLPAGPLLLSMFGRDFVSAAPALTVLAIGLVARAAGGHAEELLIALGHQGQNVRIALVAACVALGLAFAAAPVFGPIGAAAAMMCAAVIRSVLFVRAAHRLTGYYTGIGRDTFSGGPRS